MKIKKFFFAIAMTLFVGGASTTMVSCNDDDVKTVLELVDMLFSSTDELAGTVWADSPNEATYAFEFDSGQSGVFAFADENGETQQVQFAYTLDTQNNILTIKFSDETWRFTITEYTAGKSMVLNDGEDTIRLYYIGSVQ